VGEEGAVSRAMVGFMDCLPVVGEQPAREEMTVVIPRPRARS
jgi:hypothetical protein